MKDDTVSRSAVPRIMSLLLHAHLPYGIRPDLENSLEQAWLFEAVTGCYLPLLDLVQSLKKRPEAPWFTLSLSPTLLELWAHSEFKTRYRKHLKEGLTIIENEAANRKHALERRQLALEIRKNWLEASKRFEAIDGKLAEAFSQEAQKGKIELITTAATHAFLPAYQNNAPLRHFQIENGIRTFTKHTGIEPKGFWLPECAYFPGLEADLQAHGIEYFCLEQLGLSATTPPSPIRQPLACPNGLLAIGRDTALSQNVWSARSGYPGQPVYKEFHRDGIEQVDEKTCAGFALPTGDRLPFGLKYWSVTGAETKNWYNSEVARNQAKVDAADFVSKLEATEEGLIFLPFDAELFGHWWHEGPIWLKHVIDAVNRSPKLELTNTHKASKAFKNPTIGRPAASTWGRKNDYSFWINRDTDWIYPLICQASQTFALLVSDLNKMDANPLIQRALRQASRELLLASASDWPFMIHAGSTVEYAMQRIREHISRFHFLAQAISRGSIDEKHLSLLEKLNPAFEEPSFKSFTT
ncbi:MAG: 1,4-alpha-glucan branching protein domain-containing protein [Verrucomicrobiota bacterium]